MTEAEKRIAAGRAQALTGVQEAAAAAASEIVERLIGRGVSPEDARAAVASVQEGTR